MNHLAAYWHLWTVTAVIVWIALHCTTHFVLPALRLKVQLAQANTHLSQWLGQSPGAPIDLDAIEQSAMTTPALRHAWQQYATSLQPQWESADTGPLGAARQRVSHLSRAFFANMNMRSDGGRLDLADMEHLASADEEMAALWAEYQQAVDTLQHLESTSQARAGQWQASSHAENFFTDQSLVDSPLQTHFFAHIPGILTGVGIIGTFTGLIAGLIGFDVSNPAQVQSELSQLVQTVGHAFLVSALAITLAMVFTWLEKSLLTGRYQQVEQLQQNLDSLFTPHVGAQQLERLTLATEMQASLSHKILQQLRSGAPAARSR
ncbi:MotA/TolQ/ExbB proton channel family protein [Limnohabitans sp. Rim8]|uniref:MotA/TolQ/ExbB proton channel family protein n=1 Tax=Limnohabitans sp. Rim8 TaxID=1100718 RepID=UPI0026346EA0|nr:MotA/TolQ/ExbB proton channel family protein [Limnohabitans sp. Rim8]